MDKKKYHLTRPTLPPLHDIEASMEEIWENGWLTNFGPVHRRFEAILADYLNVENICLVNNGTTGLMLSLKALGVGGEVITTPYTFIATVSAIAWCGLTPVFVDIDPGTLNIEPEAIEKAITQQTRAILPVHLFGRPCATAKIDAIARNYNLKVVYDAAHAMGVRHGRRSLVSNGDISVLSFHATKGFNTFEGGAVYCADNNLKREIDALTNFGLGAEGIVGVGLNGKMNELSAAMGIAQLPLLEETISARKAVSENYDAILGEIIGVEPLSNNVIGNHNFLYYPVRITPDLGLSASEVVQRLQVNNVDSRKYFSPLLCDAPCIRKISTPQDFSLPNARYAAETVVCLPLNPDFQQSDLEYIVKIAFG